MIEVLKDRLPQITRKIDGSTPSVPDCDKRSLAGAVSQRACAFCGSRVVLYPITDALHLVHGPIGCAAYTWDIRGSLSSGPQLYRNSFSTDLREKHIIFGGEKKLREALLELIDLHQPRAAFVYSTCVVGLIGDDIEAICREISQLRGIPVIPVESPGFKGTKKSGYQAACEAVFALMNSDQDSGAVTKTPATVREKYECPSINILGDFNIAGESWIIRRYYESIGIKVVATMTGDGRVDAIRNAPRAALNVVQCSGSMTHLARLMEKSWGIPSKRVSYFGLEDTATAIYEVVRHFNDPEMMERARALVRNEVGLIKPRLDAIKRDLEGRKAALYVGGAFKAISLVKALRMLGVRTVLAGTQTGNHDDYKALMEVCDPGTVLVDDSNPLELAKYILEEDVDLFIGGVKERPIAYKLGVGFCDHNHERKIALSGFEGMLSFAEEIHGTITSPVWQFVLRRNKRDTVNMEEGK